MLCKQFSYLKFLLKSSNQHGVHSPFVYDFITKGLYKKEVSYIDLNEFNFDTNHSKKEEKVLKKIINYFEKASIITNLETRSITLDEKHNLLYFNKLDKNKVKKLSEFYANSFIVLKNIHQNKSSEENWNSIIKLQEATVTIDLFYFGLIFFRKEQVKEHFIIR